MYCTIVCVKLTPLELSWAGDCVRRSSRIHNKEGERGRGVGRMRQLLSDDGEDGEDGEEVTYVTKGDPKKM